MPGGMLRGLGEPMFIIPVDPVELVLERLGPDKTTSPILFREMALVDIWQESTETEILRQVNCKARSSVQGHEHILNIFGSYKGKLYLVAGLAVSAVLTPLVIHLFGMRKGAYFPPQGPLFSSLHLPRLGDLLHPLGSI